MNFCIAYWGTLLVGGMEQFCETEGYDPRTSNVLRVLGYFALVGLSRVHALIGDFCTSLQALYPINPFQKKNLYTSKIAGKGLSLPWNWVVRPPHRGSSTRVWFSMIMTFMLVILSMCTSKASMIMRCWRAGTYTLIKNENIPTSLKLHL